MLQTSDAGEPAEIWRGLRPCAPDGMPLIGRARGLWTAGPPPSLSAIGDALLDAQPPIRAIFATSSFSVDTSPPARM